MKKILIVRCKRATGCACTGFLRCVVGFDRREGEFSRYVDKEAQVSRLGIIA